MPERPDDKSAWAQAIDVGSVGLEMGIAVGLGYFGGSWLDGRFDTAPALMFAGVGLGIVIAARALWRVARRYMRGDGNDDGGPRPDDPDA